MALKVRDLSTPAPSQPVDTEGDRSALGLVLPLPVMEVDQILNPLGMVPYGDGMDGRLWGGVLFPTLCAI